MVSSESKKDDVIAPPPDGGWGWVVLIGSFYIVALMVNITVCFGILFSRKMNELMVSSTEISFIFSFHSIMWHFGALFTSPFVNRFGFRSVAFGGSFVASLGFMLLSFAFTPSYIFVFYSVLIPLGGGFATTVCFLIVPVYFEKRRGMAMGILMTGISVGGMVTSVMIRLLQNVYGFFGATLLQGAIIFNCCVAASLFRPVKKRKKPILQQLTEDNEVLFDEAIIHGNFDEELNVRTASNEMTNSDPKRSRSKNNRKFFSPFLSWMRKNSLALKQISVLLTGFSLASSIVGYLNFLMLVPFAVESAGHSSQFSVLCITAYSISNTSTRVLVSFLVDRKWFNRTFFFRMSPFMSTVLAFTFAATTFQEISMIVSITIYGISIGLYMSLFHVNLIDVLGMELYTLAVGINAVILAFTNATAGPLIGLIRDWSSSYALSLCTCGAMHLCSGLLLLLLPAAIRRQQSS